MGRTTPCICLPTRRKPTHLPRTHPAFAILDPACTGPERSNSRVTRRSTSPEAPWSMAASTAITPPTSASPDAACSTSPLERGQGGAGIRLSGCSNVSIEGLVMRNSDVWCCSLFFSQDEDRGTVREILFKDITVFSRLSPPSSFRGWDAEHTVEGVTIQNLRFNDEPIRAAREAHLTVGPHVRAVQFATAPASGGGSHQTQRVGKARWTACPLYWTLSRRAILRPMLGRTRKPGHHGALTRRGRGVFFGHGLRHDHQPLPGEFPTPCPALSRSRPMLQTVRPLTHGTWRNTLRPVAD